MARQRGAFENVYDASVSNPWCLLLGAYDTRAGVRKAIRTKVNELRKPILLQPFSQGAVKVTSENSNDG